jgi:hypothetical protein
MRKFISLGGYTINISQIAYVANHDEGCLVCFAAAQPSGIPISLALNGEDRTKLLQVLHKE